MTPEDFTHYLHRNIPLTAAMGLEVLHCDAQGIEVRAPLTPNLNHRNTAFGGSLATLGIVSGWSLLHLALKAEDLGAARIVIQRSECDFLEPVIAEFTAASQLPEAEWARFVKTLRRYRRSRIAVDTAIACNGKPVVAHRGVFVAVDEGAA